MNKTTNDEAIKYLSYNILCLRRTNNLTKKEMAKILGIGIASLNKIEQGILPPRLSVTILFKIQAHFGIPLSFQISKKVSLEDGKTKVKGMS